MKSIAAVGGHEETPADALTQPTGVTPANNSQHENEKGASQNTFNKSKNTSTGAEMSPLAGHELDIATAPRRNSKKWSQGTITWGEILSWMKKPADHKDCGNYLLGTLNGDERNNKSIVDRCAFTLDADYPQDGFLDRLAARLDGVEWLWHTTASSTPDAPRYRVIVPLAGHVSPEVYRTAVTGLMEDVDVTPQGTKKREFDPSSAEPERYMFKPSEGAPGQFKWDLIPGELLDAQDLITEGGVEERPARCGEASTPVPAPAAGSERDADSIREYLKSAVMGEAMELSMVEVNRNTALNKAAFKLGTYSHYADVVPDVIGEDAVRAALVDACKDNGLTVDDGGINGVLATFESGWEDGAKQPKDIPPPQNRTTQRTPPVDGPLTLDMLTGTDWEPVDLVAVRRGQIKAPEATLMRRVDGAFLLTPGKTYSFSGESGSGKSWLALNTAREVLENGGTVLYLDFESDEKDINARLKALGVPEDYLPRVTYIKPGLMNEFFVDVLVAQTYQFVVIDGVTSALTLSGQSGENLSNSAEAVTRWAASFPDRFANRGGTVVQIDHVVKNGAHGGYASGSQAKRAALTGAAFIIEAQKTFSKGQSGSMHVYLGGNKDRTGNLAHLGLDTKKGLLLADVQVNVNAETGSVRMHLLPTTQDKHGALKEKITTWLADGEPRSQREIRAHVKGKMDTVSQVVKELAASGHVRHETEGYVLVEKFCNWDEFALADLDESEDLGELL